MANCFRLCLCCGQSFWAEYDWRKWCSRGCEEIYWEDVKQNGQHKKTTNFRAIMARLYTKINRGISKPKDGRTF